MVIIIIIIIIEWLTFLDAVTNEDAESDKKEQPNNTQYG